MNLSTSAAIMLWTLTMALRKQIPIVVGHIVVPALTVWHAQRMPIVKAECVLSIFANDLPAPTGFKTGMKQVLTVGVLAILAEETL